MNVTLRETRIDSPGRQYMGFVDCDVHPFFRTPADFDPWLSAKWREHRITVGNRSRQPLHKGSLYPRMSPGNGMRMDAWPSAGGPPGSDLTMMQEQLLDLYDVRYGLLAPLVGGAAAERNLEFAAAMAHAVNEWQAAVFCDPDPRLKASVQITIEDEDAAIAEIEKRAGDARFAQANGLPISLHLGGTSGHASTGGGWPSYYHEEHPSYVQTMQTLVISLATEGVFDEVPDLKVVMVEGGFAWWPSLAWRLDKTWKRLRAEAPLKMAPSEYMRRHFWVTTQPMEEPERPEDMLQTIEWIGPDRVMFSTDYPHWDQDDPRYAFKVKLPDDWARLIYRENALSLYRLD